MLGGMGSIQGVVRFLQVTPERCLIDGTIDGLQPGLHGLHVHELGDLTQDCLRYPPTVPTTISKYTHYCAKHAGDLGNILAGPDGRALFRLEDSQLKVWDIIGRSLVVDSGEDDLGAGDGRLMCYVCICVFQNSLICNHITKMYLYV
uniref:Copper chaperone for superoxide dismutase n=1 Tax=Paramormyrops kingsleyae TaxID=1676925 RepID=A0A3B3S9H3_9TELE